MNNISSKINSFINIDYIQNKPENKYFDRKSAKIKPADLASIISAFANAEGETIAIGISDKQKKLEGINFAGEERINEFINAPKDFCKPMPKYSYEFLDIINIEGNSDRLLLLHIDRSIDQIIRTVNDKTYLRIADKTKEILGDNLRNLEYSKNIRHFEDELNLEATIDDLDSEILDTYKKNIGAEALDTKQILRARGFLKVKDGTEYFTNATILLFAKNIQQFYPNSRIRFIRYDGFSEQVGLDINIVKDFNIEGSILQILDKAKNFISTQLREFTTLNVNTGRFEIIPEYPEFAWLEGIVNAITHRDYAMSGNFIKVCMFEDRLEIESPGDLPNVVTVENIRNTRYSRNPHISRVLTEFGLVRELNEGVKRIYSDMEKFSLEPPIYKDEEYKVKLTLKNNIKVRRAYDGILDDLDKKIVVFIFNKGIVKRSEIELYTGKSTKTIITRLNNLIEKGIVKSNGKKYSPFKTYQINFS